jgi:hypothetical protein
MRTSTSVSGRIAAACHRKYDGANVCIDFGQLGTENTIPAVSNTTGPLTEAPMVAE